MVEAGIDGFVGFYWNGVLGPAGTPQAIIERLNAAINDGMRTPEARANLAKLGMTPKTGTPADFAGLIAEESRKWAAVAKAANF